jgi:hypothetical protein
MNKSFRATLEFGRTTTEVVDKASKSVSVLAAVASPLADIFLGINKKEHDLFDSLLTETEKAAQDTGDFTYDVRKMGDAFDVAAAQVKEMERASDELFQLTMGMDDANVRWASALRDLKKELGDGAKTLDINTEAGLHNTESVLAAVSAAEVMRERLIAGGIPMDQANQKYLDQIESIRQWALQLGFARDAVDKLLAKYLLIPGAKTIEINLRAGGDAAAWAALRALERGKAEGNVSMGPMEIGPTTHRAGGGPVSAGRGYLVGENGPEFFSPSTGGYVSSAPKTAAMMSGASGGAAQPVVNVVASYQPTGEQPMDALVAALWNDLIKRVKFSGGDPAAFGAA